MRSIISKESIGLIKEYNLNNLDYFMEWGAKTWQHLMAHALKHFLGTHLQGREVLEIGARYGKMSCLFALLGARVIGVDVNRKSLSVAGHEAEKWGVTKRTLFVQANGELSAFKDNSFDVVFSKSVLVVIPDLARFLDEVNAKLKPGGKIVFLENAKGPWFVHFLRTFRHGKWDYTKAHYFTPQEIKVVSSAFAEVVVRERAFPPVVLILGYKRE